MRRGGGGGTDSKINLIGVLIPLHSIKNEKKSFAFIYTLLLCEWEHINRSDPKLEAKVEIHFSSFNLSPGVPLSLGGERREMTDHVSSVIGSHSGQLTGYQSWWPTIISSD